MIAKVLAHRRPGINQASFLFGQDQSRMALLLIKALALPVKHILIMMDGDDLRIWEMPQDPQGFRMVCNPLLHIDIRKITTSLPGTGSTMAGPTMTDSAATSLSAISSRKILPFKLLLRSQIPCYLLQPCHPLFFRTALVKSVSLAEIL